MSTTNLLVELIVIGVGTARGSKPLLAIVLSLGCGIDGWRLPDTEPKRLHDQHQRTAQPIGEAP